jgi:iron complex outermembrane receptor protein
MSTLRFKSISLGLALIIGSTAALSEENAFAEDIASEVIEEVVVTGTRGKPRAVTDTAVPIDVFSSDEIQRVSHSDMQDILQTLVPSYNVSRLPLNDGRTFIRPPTLRGLPSDKTLVLVNSKRRHRAAHVTITGSGTQGPDIATIPSVALKSIEVLRDGASSQYGSDAIAGVINFILKDNSSGLLLSWDTGEFFEGDGYQNTVQANLGLPLGEIGFISLSAEYSKGNFSERAEQYCEAWFCLDRNSPRYNPDAGYNVFLDDPEFQAGIPFASLEGSVVTPAGQPNTETARFFYNAGYEFGSNGVEFYSFGNYSAYEGDASFYYRYPGNGTIEELRVEDGSRYSPLEIFSGGFTPRFFGNIEDYSILAGLRGEFGVGTRWDTSLRHGFNEIDYTLINTINPSLGPDTPTSFRPGALSNDETQFQIDLAHESDIGTLSPLLTAFGFSYMDEEYKVQEGGLTSYQPGPFAESDPFGFCTDADDVADSLPTAAGQAVIDGGSDLTCNDGADPVYRVVGVGSNGFPGYSPEFSENYQRDSYAFYVDLSGDITEKFFAQAAVRYEDYSDFGSETVWKLAGRYEITPGFALRGSVGTGFRAPTPGQQGTTNVSTRVPNGLPVATGLFPAGGDIAQALGAQELAPETARNYTLGATANFDDLVLTLDFYRIDIDGRLNAISTLDVSTDPDSGAAFDNYQVLVDAGVDGAESIGGVSYFQNAFDSKTEGFDLVATYPLQWSGGSQITTLTASLNYTKSTLTSDASEFLNAEDQYDFENLDPRWRGMLTAYHTVGKFSALVRGSYFGTSSDSDNEDPFKIQYFSPTWFWDMEVGYQFTDVFRASIGGRNVFDEYPDKADRSVNGNDYCCGRIYQSITIVPWQGGYYYLRLVFTI